MGKGDAAYFSQTASAETPCCGVFDVVRKVIYSDRKMRYWRGDELEQ